MEQIEQSLSDVLQTQTLSPEEGRQVAEAMVGALTAIHQQGMSHGHVEAASILATGETVKLRSDCLQMSTAGQAQDVAGIGATLFHAFTQRKAPSATDAQINRIPAPFAEIVRNSFARRWTLAQIANALKPLPPVTEPIPPPARPEPIAATAPERAPEAVPEKAPEVVPERPPVLKYRPAAPPAVVANPLPVVTEEEEPVVAKRKPWRFTLRWQWECSCSSDGWFSGPRPRRRLRPRHKPRPRRLLPPARRSRHHPPRRPPLRNHPPQTPREPRYTSRRRLQYRSPGPQPLQPLPMDAPSGA